MSKTSPSLCSRLHGIFKDSRPTTVKPPPRSKESNLSDLVAKSKTPSTSDAAGSGGKSSLDQKEKKFKNLVEKFKRASESTKFRGLHGQYSALVRRLAAAQKFSMIDDLLQHQKKYEEIQSEDFVIRMMLLYGHAGMAEHAHKLFDEMPQLNCERTVKSFNALLSAYVNSRKFPKAEDVLRELPEKLGIKPNLVSYNTMIKGFCKMKPLDNAVLMLSDIEKIGLEPDMITFNTLLEAFYKRGQFLEGEKMWGLIESKNLVPNIRSYNSRVRGLTREKKISDAVELVEEMETKGIEPDVHTYNALIVGYGHDENLDESTKWYAELKKKGHTPDTVTYCTLIPLLCKKGDLDMALELSQEAIKHRMLSRPGMFKPVIEGLINESRTEKAIELVRSAKLQSYFRYNPNLAINE